MDQDSIRSTSLWGHQMVLDWAQLSSMVTLFFFGINEKCMKFKLCQSVDQLSKLRENFIGTHIVLMWVEIDTFIERSKGWKGNRNDRQKGDKCSDAAVKCLNFRNRVHVVVVVVIRWKQKYTKFWKSRRLDVNCEPHFLCDCKLRLRLPLPNVNWIGQWNVNFSFDTKAHKKIDKRRKYFLCSNCRFVTKSRSKVGKRNRLTNYFSFGCEWNKLNNNLSNLNRSVNNNCNMWV